MSRREGEVREIPFLKNDMKEQAPTTGRPADQTDAPGKSDSEFTEETQREGPKSNKTVNVDDAQLEETNENKG
jgi:hypothetical protein